MKKTILFFAVTFGLALTVSAQKRGNGKEKSKENKEWKKDKQGKYEDDEIKIDGDDKAEVFGNNRRHERHDGIEQNGQGQKYSKNVPAPVRKAFEADFPNATNVTWIKSKGVWTAKFRNVIGVKRVSYKANGTRVSGTSNSTKTVGDILNP